MLGRQWRWLAVLAMCCSPGFGCAEGSASDDDDAAGLFDDDTGKEPIDDTGKKGTDTGEGDDAVVDTDTGVDPDSGTSMMDGGVIDTGVIDTGVIDTGPVDNGIIDTGPIDTGPIDTGPRDTGVDLGPPDTGPVDTGPVDTGPTTPMIRCGSGLFSTMCAGRYACCVDVAVPTDGGSIPLASLCGCQVRGAHHALLRAGQHRELRLR